MGGRARAGVAAVLGGELSLLAYGCSSEPTGAGKDGGAPDTDVAWIAPIVREGVGADAARSDTDARSVEKGDWRPVSNLPLTTCLYASDPQSSVEPTTFEPCQGRSGCLRSKPTLATGPGVLSFGRTEPVMIVGGAPHLLSKRHLPLDGFRWGADVSVVEDLEGHVKFAMAASGIGTFSDCLLSSVSLGPSGIGAYAVATADFETSGGHGYLVWNSLANGPAATSKAFSFATLRTAFETRVYAADQHLFVGEPSFGVFEEASSTLGTSAQAAIAPSLPRPVPNGAIALDANGTGFGFLSFAGAFVVVYEPAAGRHVTNVLLDRTNGNELVWAERSALGPSEYWTAPFTSAAGSIQPRRVTAFPDSRGRHGIDMAVNAGMIVNIDGFDRALVTRLSDGWSWEVSSLPSEFFMRGLWADVREVWLSQGITFGPDGDPSKGLSATSIVRLTLASLGAPTVPPQ